MHSVIFTVFTKISSILPNLIYISLEQGEFVYQYMLLTASLILMSTNLYAQYYKTLPKGVRLIMGKHVESSINSSYNNSQKESPYSYELDIDISMLEKIDEDTIKDALNLFKPYENAYESINFGTHKIEAQAKVSVDAYAFGFGITNNITAYIGVPIYRADVNVNYKKIKSNNNKEVAALLQNEYGDNWAQTLGNIVENFYDIDAPTIQSAIVNGLGYEQLGKWSGSGLGDIEAGAMFNVSRKKDYGFLLTLGTIIPTGYVDDPDIIQDIGFGDGQWDLFVEFGGGRVFSKYITLNSYARYTHQLASKKDLRTPYSESVTLSDHKNSYNEKLGDKIILETNLEVSPTEWLTLKPALIYNYTQQAKYESSNKVANKILALNSESNSTNLKLLAQFSTVSFYKQKKFLLPAEFNIAYNKMVDGKNTPKVDTVEFEFRMYF